MIGYLVYNISNIIPKNKLPAFPVFEVVSNNYPRAKAWQWQVANDTFSMTWNWQRRATLSLTPEIWKRNISESTILYWLQLICDRYCYSFEAFSSSIYNDNILLQYNDLLYYIYSNIYNDYIQRLNYETYTIPYEPYWKYSFNNLIVEINGQINPSVKSQENQIQIVKNGKQGSKSMNEMPGAISFLPIVINDRPEALINKNIYMYGNIKVELVGDKYWSQNIKFWITKQEVYIV